MFLVCPWSWGWGGYRRWRWVRDTPAGRHSPALTPPFLGNSFVRHNARQLTRVYPLGLRMNSANYSPQEMWNSGCQLGELGCSRSRDGQGAAFWGGLWGAMGGPSSDECKSLTLFMKAEIKNLHSHVSL